MGAFPGASQLETDQRSSMKKLGAAIKRGTATLVGGTVTVTDVPITANTKITLGRNTPGGAVGDLDTRASNRTIGPAATGQFIITSASGTDTSTVDWHAIG